MKIAYLLMAHKSPELLSRLIDRLQAEHVIFKIHLDVRADLKSFEKEVFKSSRYPNNIEFISKRLKTRWGGFKVVTASVNLLESVLPCNADHIIFVSGQDYPIKNQTFRENFLKENAGKILMEIEPVNIESGIHRLDDYHFADYVDYKKDAFHKSNIPMPLRILNRLLPRRKYLKGIKFYTGRVQFIMPSDVAKFIVDEYKRNTKFKRFYKFIIAADEQFIHTMLMNSKFANRVKRHHVTYADYNAPHPVTWRISDFEQLSKQKTLFARKFDDKIDSAILDKIDQELL